MISDRINFLESDRRFRGAQVFSDLQTSFGTYIAAVVLALAAIAALWLYASIRLADANTELEQVHARQVAADNAVLAQTAHVDKVVTALEPLLPQIKAIRTSGQTFADKMGQIGVAKGGPYSGVWVDEVRVIPPSISVTGGTRGLAGLALFVQALQAAGYDPHVTSNTPKRATGVFFSYALQMGIEP